MIKRIMIVLLIPSLIVGFLITNFYKYPKEVYTVGCTLDFFQNEKAKSSCSLYPYGQLMNKKNFSTGVIDINRTIAFVDASSFELHEIQVAGFLSVTKIYNDEIKNKSCQDLKKDTNSLSKADLNEVFVPNILKTDSLSLYPTAINGVFCTVNFDPATWESTSNLIKISPQHLDAYDSMLLKAKALNILSIFLEYIPKVLPFTILYLIYFSILIIRYYIKLNFKFLTKK